MNRFASILLIFALAASVIGTEIPEAEPFFEVEKDVQFDLFTLRNPIDPQVLIINDTDSITHSHFDPNVPTRVFAHGFQSKGELRASLIQAYFVRSIKNVNLIAVNWEAASRTFNYLAASRYVEKIGSRTAEFLDFLVNEKFLNLSDVTVIGFSLGSHIAGITGKRLQSGKLPKIIGLDPASPLFSLDKPEDRLDSNDAEYVETIQTSRLGFFDPLGHVSFYPNGGRSQPGCTWDITGKCSHQAAYRYYAESICNDKPLIGYMCESLSDIKDGNCTQEQKTIMGGEPGAHKQPSGIYYISITIDPGNEKPDEFH